MMLLWFWFSNTRQDTKENITIVLTHSLTHSPLLIKSFSQVYFSFLSNIYLFLNIYVIFFCFFYFTSDLFLSKPPCGEWGHTAEGPTDPRAFMWLKRTVLYSWPVTDIYFSILGTVYGGGTISYLRGNTPNTIQRVFFLFDLDQNHFIKKKIIKFKLWCRFILI